MAMDDVLASPRPRASSTLLHVALFVATLATTLWAGFSWSPLRNGPWTVANVLAGGLPFAASLIAILLTHEMGHYLVARRYGVWATLPYFIPIPFGFGTLGAVIRMKSAIPSRRAALDIAAAGPLAGLAVALPLLAWGLAHSSVVAVPHPTVDAIASPYAALRAWLEGRPAGGVESLVFGDSVLTLAMQHLVVGPLPPGMDVYLHPVALAAWIGLLVTTLNLVPMGQLDGGHILYALLGRRGAHVASRIVSWGLLGAGLFLSWNWLVWWGLTRFLVGARHPPSLDEAPLDGVRQAVAVLSIVLFVLTFVPVPVS
jgi:membrane-associated protease RseP (regulator of RpoE activity)